MRSTIDVRIGASWCLAVLMLVPALAGANSSSPPDGRTGAPGENTCAQCHGSASGTGSLVIQGVPAEYVPGDTYNLTVQLEDSNQSRWGFELTAVDGAGDGAGSFTVTDPTHTQLSDSAPPARDYVKQTLTGTYAGTGGGPVSWGFDWTAPDADMGTIGFYAAGNAADGNGGTSGDFVYTAVESASAAAQPTATPTGEPTATPTDPASPTPTPSGNPTPVPTVTLVDLRMPLETYRTGDTFYLEAFVYNASGMTMTDNPLFVILDVAGDYWFGPSWIPDEQGIDSYDRTFDPGPTLISVIDPFPWPGGVGSAAGIVFWGALTDPGITAIVGEFDQVTFGWAP